jgi:hypothetical protein
MNGRNLKDYIDNAIYLNKPYELNFPWIIYDGTLSIEGYSNVTSINGVNVKLYLSHV